jgi:hypothetical protein
VGRLVGRFHVSPWKFEWKRACQNKGTMQLIMQLDNVMLGIGRKDLLFAKSFDSYWDYSTTDDVIAESYTIWNSSKCLLMHKLLWWNSINPKPWTSFQLHISTWSKKIIHSCRYTIVVVVVAVLLLILTCWIQLAFKSCCCSWIQHVLSLLVVGTYIFEFNMSWVTQKIPVGNYNVKMSIVDEKKKVWFFLWCN